MIYPSTQAPTLHHYRPTNTTVSFTVSTRRPATTLTARLLSYAQVAARVLIGSLILLLFRAKWKQHVARGNHLTYSDWTLTSAAYWIATRAEWRWLAPVGLLGLWLVVRRGYTEESLLVLRGLGIQTSSSSNTYLTTSTTRFIPTTQIQDIFIHEAFKGFEVKFYLVIVIEGEEDVLVVFPNLLPKRQILEEVWRGARSCLYEPKS
ncbi:GPI-GlcNAc transferase complex, PIG-H component-domain-containing protein [Lineolata rhizophorae]|uniref:GPI-GlcNAc transferase complex, PIG-H component-domain-containing protein n=1 Tax=Lineolata rhizophorae TaxID=578093 RepID=A0A6A6P407_9PEZI|nr:GPI-GlcNAc transferase complex, PIG-H component-domain-containing protein [Lineolata rhizophorae]